MNADMRSKILLITALCLLQPSATYAKETIGPLYESCRHEADYLARGVGAAKRDIQNGKLHLRLYVGAAPFGPEPGEVDESRVRGQLLNARGIETEQSRSHDIPDCVKDPYWAAYQGEMWKAIEAKFGARFWQDIDRDTRRRVKHRLIKPMVRSQ